MRLVTGCLPFVGCLLVLPGTARAGAAAPAHRSAQVAKQVAGHLLDARAMRTPLAFEANTGQFDRRVRFVARGGGRTLFLTGNEAVVALPGKALGGQEHGRRDPRWMSTRKSLRRGPGSLLRMRILGTSGAAMISGRRKLPGVVNYLIGNDPARWHTQVPTFSQVQCTGVYPGTDLVYYGNANRLEYDFVLKPGADPRRIQLAFAGADRLQLARNGDLVASTRSGDVRLKRPYAYQVIDGKRTQVACTYSLAPGGQQVAFRTARYDTGRPLVVDPTLEYSTYLGGGDHDEPAGIAVDSAGAAYVAGVTYSTNFPTTFGAYQTAFTGDWCAFVAKLSAQGTGPVYSTYIGGGGPGSSRATGVAVDSVGAAYVVGYTDEDTFPTTVGAIQRTPHGANDVFVTKLNPAGSGLAYSTYLGGTDEDFGNAIAVDSSGAAYITGQTCSDLFPWQNPIQGTIPGLGSAFVSKISSTGAELRYSTYLGGGGLGYGTGIALDATGKAYVVGVTNSGNYPTTPQAYQRTLAGTWDVVVSALSASGSELVASTYLGGEYDDLGSGIAVDASGAVYVVGNTSSVGFPTTPGAFQTKVEASYIDEAFVTKLDGALSSLVYSTLLGGDGLDSALAVAADASGAAFVVGQTSSTNFPTTAGAFQPSRRDSTDLFVARLDPAGSEPAYSTYLGSTSTDHAFAIALDATGAAYVAGMALGADFPTTTGTAQANSRGDFDCTITKLYLPRATRLAAADAAGRPGDWVTLRATLTTPGGKPLAGLPVRFTVAGYAASASAATTNSSGVASQSYRIPPVTNNGAQAIGASYAGNVNIQAATASATLTVASPTTLTVADATGKVGTPTTLSATLTSPDSLGPMVGASIAFTINGTQVGTGTVDNTSTATCSYTVALGLKGSATIGASYAGSTDYRPASGTATLTTTPTASTVTASPASASPGAVALLTATLYGGKVGLEQKPVTVAIDGTSYPVTTGWEGGICLEYTVPADAAPGAHAFVVSFGGDKDYLPSSGSSTLTVQVGTTLSVDAASGNPGSAVTLAATLARSDTGAAVPGEPVVFKVDGVAVAGSPATTGPDGVATLSYTIPADATLGDHTVAVSFAGDVGYDTASGSSTLVVLAPTLVLLDPVTGAAGSTVTLSAALWRIDTGAAMPGKPVHFSVDGTEVAGSPATTDSAGTATISYTIPAGALPGAHDLAAEFRGDSTSAPAWTGVPLTVTIATALAVTSATGPTGGSVTLKATLARTDTKTALSGKPVSFTLDGAEVTGSPVTTNASGVATLAYAIPAGSAPGSKRIDAAFAGDDTYAPAGGSGTLTATPGLTKLFVAAPTPKAQGAIIRIYSYLQRTSDNGNLAARTVTFQFNGVAAGSATTDANGLAETYYTIPAGTPTGSIAVQAGFSGDSLYAGCTKTGTATVTAGTATSMSGNSPSGAIGFRVSLYAYLFQTLPASPKVMVQGKTVDFYVDGVKIGSGLTDANGYALYSWQVPVGTAAGAHSLVSKFVGDTVYGAASRTGAVTTSGLFGANVSMGSRQGVRGLPVKLYAYLWKSLDGAMLAGRTLTFQVDGVDVGTGATDANGYATCTYDVPFGATLGSHPVKATYAGDATYGAGAGSTTLTVAARDTLAWSMPNSTCAVGKKVTLYVYTKSVTTGALVSGKTITFKVDGTQVGSAVTNASGYASVAYTVPAGTPSGAHAVLAQFAGDAAVDPGSKSATLTVP